MANNYTQGNEWDPPSFCLSQLAPVDYSGIYQGEQLDSTFPAPIGDPLTPNVAILPTEPAMSMLPPTVLPEYPTIEGWSLESITSEGSKIFGEGRGQASRTRKFQSPEAIERRRQQNRASQLAFRARTKKLVEDLREQLTECTEHNYTMYVTMQNLLEKTEALKRAIEGALASQRSIYFENCQREKGRHASSNE